jgi:hypothetical protein
MQTGLDTKYPIEPSLVADKALRDTLLDSYKVADEVKELEKISKRIEAELHYGEHQRLLRYLKKKYSGYIGVPSSYLKDELLCESDKELSLVKALIREELGVKKTPPFVDFDVVADAVLALKELHNG